MVRRWCPPLVKQTLVVVADSVEGWERVLIAPEPLSLSHPFEQTYLSFVSLPHSPLQG